MPQKTVANKDVEKLLKSLEKEIEKMYGISTERVPVRTKFNILVEIDAYVGNCLRWA